MAPKKAPAGMPLEEVRLDQLKAAELKLLCVERGIPTGASGVMIESLQDYMRTHVSRPSGEEEALPMPISMWDDNDDECKAIIVTTTEIAEDAVMISNAKKAINVVLEGGEISVEHNLNPVVGNRHGLSLATLPREIQVIKQKLVEQEKRFVEQDKKFVELEKISDVQGTRISSLEKRVHDLSLSLRSYQKIRNRFIDSYYCNKCDPEITSHQKKQIAQGSAAAHGGDAAMDAELYRDGGGRTDVTIFKQLYGYVPHVIWSITHEETIALLNTHAGVKASITQVGSEKFYALFTEFINAFEDSGYNTEYLKGTGTATGPAPRVNSAFWAFMRCFKDEVRVVERGAPGEASV
ncbi:hypothetical protein C7212DRAFT_341364 [Tuber magnatum]|uniref:SAP domain-containing protein n=1 Tax=Tuber magnatum TaxID=42249 RepID=A0A317SZA8_9PEZI|nr:hypothetical protein C7212DRAFT_341364 [Tuber magnatum]